MNDLFHRPKTQPKRKRGDGNLGTFAEGRLLLQFKAGYIKETTFPYPDTQIAKELGVLKRLRRQYGERHCAELIEAFFLVREIADPTNQYEKAPLKAAAMCKLDVLGFVAAIPHIQEAASPKNKLLVMETRPLPE